jgi:hypothetical protein
MGLRRLSVLLTLCSVFTFAACGDNIRLGPDDAQVDGDGSNGGDDGGVDALTCDTGESICSGACVDTQTDESNCGTCGNMCGSSSTCCSGVCTNLNSPTTCGTTCQGAVACGSNMACQSGECVSSCSSPLPDLCNGSCVNTQTDVSYCGDCNTACDTTAGEACTDGICCGANTDACGTAACIDLTTDPNNCGACGEMCDTGAGETCDNGKCCGPGTTNCGGTCVDTDTSNTHCGGCMGAGGMTCDTGNGESCSDGKCCPAGRINCNGTCIDPTSDEAHCGGCANAGGEACASGETCSESKCCGPGLINCGGTCINPLNDNANCGNCATSGGQTCDTGNGEVCSGGACTPDGCGPGEQLCNGACTNTATNHQNCGGCGTPCASNEVCDDGSCEATCTGGRMNCNGSCVDLTSDPDHCGTCTTICPPQDECVNSQCQLDCPSGETLCNGTCVNLLQSNTHCGDCLTDCGTGTCQNGVCCAPGLTNCGGTCVNLASNDNHCGSCPNACQGGTACTPRQGPGSPVATCCAQGENNCGGTCSDPLTDEANCGACDAACGPNQTCDNGKCCGPGTSNQGGICCPLGQVNCSGTCTNLNSSATCGTTCQSTTSCGPNEACQSGQCVSTCDGATPDLCNGSCTDTQTDENNCGMCGTQCPVGTECTGGDCGPCPGNIPDVCSNTCTNTNNDPTNCGSCGVFCFGGEHCSSGFCCGDGLESCGSALCFDLQNDNDNCGSCGNSCGTGSTCVNGDCSCGFGQTQCSDGCQTTSIDPQNCGACGNVCGTGANAGKPFCISGGCVAACPPPLFNCNGVCVNRSSDNANCGSCNNPCNPTTHGCSAGSCVPKTDFASNPPAKCIGGGPPIGVPTGGGTTCTGNLGATSFTFGLCSRTKIGQLTQDLFTDAFDSTSGPYVPTCASDADCSPLKCTTTDVPCTTDAQCDQNDPTDVCRRSVVCVGGTCVGGGVGVNGTETPVARNTSSTHVGGEFWVFGTTGLVTAGTLEVKQRLLNKANISFSKDARIYGDALVGGNWNRSGNPTITVDGTIYTPTCPPLTSGLVMNGSPTCVSQSFNAQLPEPCGTASDLVDVKGIVRHFSQAGNNDNALIGLSQDILDNPSGPVRLDLPCGVYYFNTINGSAPITIVVHGRTAIVIGGAIRISQQLTFDVQPTGSLDIFVGATMKTSQTTMLGSPAYPRLTRMYFGGSSCVGSGTLPMGQDFTHCCSGVAESGVCTSGGGNMSDAIQLSGTGFYNGLLWAGYGRFFHSNPIEMYGSVFANHYDSSGSMKIHYDKGAAELGDECPPPSGACESCRDCNNQACVGGTCGQCTSDIECCAPLRCDAGTCRL